MAALRHEGCLCLHASSLQRLVELLTLTAGYHIILLTMEDDDGWAILVDITGSTQTEILVGLLGQLRTQQHILRRVLTHLHGFTTIHSRQVDRAGPVAGGIHGTAGSSKLTERAFKVDTYRTYLGIAIAAGGGCNRGQMTT